VYIVIDPNKFVPWWGWFLGAMGATFLSAISFLISAKYASRVANVIAVVFGIASLLFVLIGFALAIIWASNG